MTAAFVFTSGEGKTALDCSVTLMGKDVAVAIGGGEAHIGSVALAVPRKSLTGSGNSATVSLLNLTGHKDDFLTKDMAERLAKELNAVVVVTAGFHLDHIGAGEIEAVLANGEAACTEILRRLRRKS